jgi:hypothetical protein
MSKNWLHAHWLYRVLVSVDAAGYARQDTPAEAGVNFTQLFAAWGERGVFSPESIRVAEIDNAGVVIDDDVPAQFDRADDYSAAANAAGTLVFLLKGKTPARVTRYFHVYFDTTDGFHDRPSTPPQVSLADGVEHEGQESYHVVTPGAVYYYHKFGAGFASIEDPNGIDWIGYRPAGSADGRYRGLPNLVHPQGYFHPGRTGCTSEVAAQGPLKLTINSRSLDDQWVCTWAIYPHHARLSVHRADGPYWFCYAGTPGGAFDQASGFTVRAAGERAGLGESWEQDIPKPAWVYFGTAGSDRIFYLVRHVHDAPITSYWPMERSMTVFGFGRSVLEKHLQTVPGYFTIGFAEAGGFLDAARAINAAFRPLRVQVGRAEANAVATETR